MEICPEALWGDLCRADPGCTFYQTPAWLRVAARNDAAEIVPLLLRPGGEPACLPLLRKRRWGSDRHYSPFGSYAALVCPRKLAAEDLEAIGNALRGLNLVLVSSPFTPNAFTVGKPFTSRIQVIDLSALDPENPMRDWEEGQRRRVRVAQKNGVIVRSAESSRDWDRYHELYRLTLDRWGGRATKAYPKALFDDIRASLSGNPAMKLWVAEHEGEIGAGYLAFYHNRHAVPWHGAADRRFFQLGASQALFLAMIEDARRRGCTVFDLTGSGGLSGVEAFKSRFGTKTVEFQSSLNRVGSARWVGWLGDARRAFRKVFHLGKTAVL